MPLYYLICGYRGTGKDTLYKWFCSDKTSQLWRRLSFKNIPSEQLIDSDCVNKTVKIGLADAVKRDVLAALQLPLFNHEAYKDKSLQNIEDALKVQLDPSIDKTKTLRDLYISVGTTQKSKNINYWCEKAYLETEHEEIVCITDWRFKHEYDYFKEKGTVITVRVFRKDVLVPPEDVESEHSLDGFKTDLVYVPCIDFEQEKLELEKMFPQYL